jgi:hypothetical protein
MTTLFSPRVFFRPARVDRACRVESVKIGNLERRRGEARRGVAAPAARLRGTVHDIVDSKFIIDIFQKKCSKIGLF